MTEWVWRGGSAQLPIDPDLLEDLEGRPTLCEMAHSQWAGRREVAKQLLGCESGQRGLKGQAAMLSLWHPPFPPELTLRWVNPFICQTPTIGQARCQAAVGWLCCHSLLLMGCTDGLKCFVVPEQLDKVGKSHQ